MRSIQDTFSHLDARTTVRVTKYRQDVKVSWPPPYPRTGNPDGCADRASLVQSQKSRLRCAFSLANAETNFLAMATLTYRKNPPDYETVRINRTRFLDSLRHKYRGSQFGWFLEFTRAGVAHFHLFMGDSGDLGLAIKREKTREVSRHGKKTQILA